VKVNGRLSGKSLVWIRVLSVGTVLLLVGYVVLGLSSRPRPSGQGPMEGSAIPPAAFFPTASPTVGSSLGVPGPDSSGRRTRDPRAAFVKLPIMFEPNRGQSNPDVKFLARGAGYSLFLDADGAVLASPPARNSSHPNSGAKLLRMKLAGANRSAFVTGAEQLPGKSNYFIGGDPAKWHRDIPQFARVRYQNIYPGINLVFYGSQGQLEYDFQVAPGANPARPELEFDSSTKLELEGGDLVLHGQGDSVRLHAPHVYQRLGSREQSVEGHFALRAANRVGFEVGRYDHGRELIIDPVLTYSTYFGGSGSESNASVAVDTAGFIYLTGSTTSMDLPVTAGVKQSTLNGAQNIFILKLNPQGGSAGIVYLTYLGGGRTDTSAGIAVDGGGNAFIAGTTSSTDFPTTLNTAYQTAPAAKGPQCTSACMSVFVSVLNSGGSALNYSSYLSGNGNDIASGMTIDNRSNLFVTGTTTSTDQANTVAGVEFPASAPPQGQAFQPFPRLSAPIQFFVTKVNTVSPRAASIAYSTYFGGGTFNAPNPAVGGGIAVDKTGNIYFTGKTNFTYTGCAGCQSADFPILNAYQPCLDQPPPATITNPASCSNTSSTIASDAFIAKLNPNAAQASQLLWSTFFGGSGDDSGTGIAVDSGAANVYITGTTDSHDITIPTSIAPYQKCLDTPVNPTTCTPPPLPVATDAYVARFNNPATGNISLTYFSYLGGTGNDTGSAITVDTANGALLTGSTSSVDFPFFPNPTSNPICAKNPCVIQSHLGGASAQQNAFFAHINTTTTTVTGSPVGEYVTYFGGNNIDNGTSIALDLGLNAYIAGDTMSSANFPLAVPLQLTLNGPKDAFVAKLGTAALLSVTGALTLGSGQQYVSAGSQATFTYTITNNGPDLATGITFRDDLTGDLATFSSVSAASGTCTQPTPNNPVECGIATLQSGSTATVTVVLTPTSSGGGGQFSFSGGAVTVFWGNPLISVPGPTVTALASDFQVTVGPSNQVVSAGQTAIYTVALTPQPVYGGNISLTCSANVPSQASCNFTTNPVTFPPSSSPVTSTLNLTTTARPITTAAAPLRGPIYAIWLGLPGIALLGIGAGESNRRGKILALVLCMLFALLLLQPACSSKGTTTAGGGTPAGTYTITLTATSGTAAHNYPFTLTVN
jgi:uncharacterized repeat protein (TIGR01451 family)